jgi:membrane-associated phospholipid phosphatase
LCQLNFYSLAQNADIDLLKKINNEYGKVGGPLMKGATNSDTPISLGIPSILMISGVLKKDSTAFNSGIELFLSQTINGIVTVSLKNSIQRERPFITYPAEIKKYTNAGSPSFPSGHTSMAFSTATSLSLCYPKWYVIVPAFIWAGSVGYSRMYLGVHYPSDILAGALLGTGSALLSHFIYKKLATTRFIKKTNRVRI